MSVGLFALSDMERVRKLSAATQKSLVKSALDLGLLEETALLQTISEYFELPFLKRLDLPAEDSRISKELGYEFLASQQVWIGRDADRGVQLVLSDPEQLHLLEEIQFLLDEPVAVAFATQATLRSAGTTSDENPEPVEQDAHVDVGEIDQKLGNAGQRDGPVMRFVGDCIAEAVDRGASDIHFSSSATDLSVKLRLHGVLSPIPIVKGLDPKAIFARIKVLADMDVTERRRPQDGRFTQSVSGRKVHFRVSSIPTAYGESLVVRPLDPKTLRLGWDKLGIEPTLQHRIQEILSQRNGLFLVTGPTGSGKSTTLYTALDSLNTGRRKIITVEDPVEYQLDGIDQIQVHPDIGLGFGVALRSVLRQDPNVIMVGEIRDRETAEIACRAALVGRLVLSTLHTNSAAGAYARLVDLGVEPFIVKDVLRGVLSQELMIKPCPDCVGAGCARCEHTGAIGRVLRSELLEGADCW